MAHVAMEEPGLWSHADEGKPATRPRAEGPHGTKRVSGLFKMDRWMDGWVDGQTGGQVDGY